MQYLLIPLAYLLGSFPSAYVAGRLIAGIDITQHGSGNVGGTNALRVLGLWPAIGVAVMDVAKGLVPALLAQHAFGGNVWQTMLVAFAAVVGHNFSIFLRFKGGKGIATTIGIIFALFPSISLVLLPLAIMVVVITRYVSLASIFLVVLLPAALVYRQATQTELAFAAVLAVMGLVKHRENIKRLLSGTERKIGRSQKAK